MKKLLWLPLATLIFLGSCKPDKSVDTPKLRTDDPKALSAALKVWHGVRTNGNAPAMSANPNRPVLSQQSNNQNFKAIAGRYAIIQPEVESGSVAGYNVQINGAGEYFKVDYSKPRDINGRFRNPSRQSKHNLPLYRGLGIDSTGGTFDSSIVLVIPSSIQPGQFCITYWAYDYNGNISNPITACITVTSFGGDASSTYLHGTWHITGFRDDSTQAWEPVFGVGDTIYSSGYCVNGHIVDSFGSGPINYPAYIYKVNQADLSFSSTGGMQYAYSEIVKEFNFLTSSCSNFLYNTTVDGDNISGAWSFTSATNTMVLIFEFDDTGVPDPEAYEYKLTKISNNKIYLYDPSDDSWLRMEK